MRVAFTGVSHWHLPLYLDPVLAAPGVAVAGVADPHLLAAGRAAAGAACPAFADWREMLDAVRPDFVFVLGRHCDMAETARHLVAARIPFAIEKPAGLNAAEVAALARDAAAARAFAAVPFVFRQSAWFDALRKVAARERVLYAAFKFVAGSNARYRDAGCDWMLRRATAGGGCMLNLGIHFLDLAAALFDAPALVAGATMSNARDGLDVEDHAAVLLRAGAGAYTIETGYLYPAPHMAFDMHFSIRTERHYFAAKDASGMEIRDDAGASRFLDCGMTNVPWYPGFVRDVLRRAERGEAPMAGLADMRSAMDLLDAAYRMAPLPCESRSEASSS